MQGSRIASRCAVKPYSTVRRLASEPTESTDDVPSPSDQVPMVIRQPLPSVHADAGGLDRGRPFRDLAVDELLQIVRRTALGRNSSHAEFLHPILHGRIIHRDRKSTRLNSSHLVIS